MRLPDFHHEFKQFLFRGSEEVIRAIEADHFRSADPPKCAAPDIWEIFVRDGAEAEKILSAHPLAKAAGFALNWDRKYVYVLYSESGSSGINRMSPIAEFDGHLDDELSWYYDCPIVAEELKLSQYYSSVDAYDRFTYRFPFAEEWNDCIYAPDSSGFHIVDGVLLRCVSPEPVIHIPEGVVCIASNAFVAGRTGFSACNQSLNELELPGSLRRIEQNAFRNCGNLHTIHLAEGVEAIADFRGRELTIPYSLRSLSGDIYFGGIQRIHVPEGHQAFSMENDCLCDLENRRVICWAGSEETIVVPEGILEIGEGAFSFKTQCKKIVLPDGLLGIGNSAFSDCQELEEVSLPDSLHSIGNGAFSGCGKLKNLVLPDRLQTLGRMVFWNCRSLERIAVPEGVGSVDLSCFTGCNGLRDLVIPETASDIQWDFSFESTPWYQNQTKQPLFTIGTILVKCNHTGSRVEIPPQVRQIKAYAFRNLVNLEEVIAVSPVEQLSPSAFAGCSNLKTLVLPGIKIADCTGSVLTLAMCRGFLSHPERFPEEVRQDQQTAVLGRRKKLLPWVFETDNADALKFFLENTKTTKAKFKSEYLIPAQEAGAQACLAYLSNVSL